MAQSTYTAIGTYPPQSPHPKYGPQAVLEYATLDDALQKIRDWAEADEIDDEPHFVRYSLVTPKSASLLPQFQSPGPGTNGSFHLRLTE